MESGQVKSVDVKRPKKQHFRLGGIMAFLSVTAIAIGLFVVYLRSGVRDRKVYDFCLATRPGNTIEDLNIKAEELDIHSTNWATHATYYLAGPALDFCVLISACNVIHANGVVRTKQFVSRCK